jgi:hypothetical protein
MVETRTQNYANHAHQPRQTFIASLFGFSALGLLAVEAFKNPTLINLALVSLSLAVVMLVIMSRTYIVKLQDRIIRLEMRLRLERLGRGADFARLGHQQVVALRFASDDELPELIDRALTERLSAKAIKQAVKQWQPDWYRT